MYSKWGWKQTVWFAVALMCATGALVAAGLHDTPPPQVVTSTAAPSNTR
jgi:hypothetical protein